MYENWIRIGLFILGGILGLSCSAFFVSGFKARTRVESGRKPFGRVKPLDPVVNTDPEFVDEIRQDRFQKGLEPYINEG